MAGAARIYRETASGAKSERRELARALKSITAGDTLLVTRLDRLARSTRDLLNIGDAIAKAGAGFRSLADAWADTIRPLRGSYTVASRKDTVGESPNLLKSLERAKGFEPRAQP